MTTFPVMDEWDRPMSALAPCPTCGEDELGLIHADLILCYSCGWRLERGARPTWRTLVEAVIHATVDELERLEVLPRVPYTVDWPEA